MLTQLLYFIAEKSQKSLDNSGCVMGIMGFMAALEGGMRRIPGSKVAQSPRLWNTLLYF